MANHWEVKCITEVNGSPCGHRKGSHYLDYGPGFHGLKSIGHCAVAVGDNHGKPICSCWGFSDGMNWLDGRRLQ